MTFLALRGHPQMTSRSEAERGGYINVTTCDIRKGGIKGSVTSHTSHLWKGTTDSQIHVVNSSYVSGRGTFRDTVFNFTQFYALN